MALFVFEAAGWKTPLARICVPLVSATSGGFLQVGRLAFRWAVLGNRAPCQCGKIWDEFRANQDRIVEASLPSFDKERVLGSILREIDSCTEPETRERKGYFLPNGWSLRFAGVCLVLVALPVLARFGLEFAKSKPTESRAVLKF